MSHTELQDPVTRVNQYRKALHFYLSETTLPIVFCENTMYDISTEFRIHIDSGRLEYMTFDGNRYDRKKGKGYGEALIMKYAIEKSKLIKESKYIIKITGRIIITNINHFSSSFYYTFNNLFRSNINENFIPTYLFIARPFLIAKFVERYREKIKEVPPTKESVEHQWFRALTKDTLFNNTTFIPFILIPNVVGISGTTGKSYSMKDRLIWNLACSFRFEMARNNKVLALTHLAAYYILYIFNKIRDKLS